MDTPPAFLYSPNAYTLGIIRRQDITCQCCGQPRAYAYAATMYCRATIAALYPWCIADGRAAGKFGGSFVGDFEGISPDPSQPGLPTM